MSEPREESTNQNVALETFRRVFVNFDLSAYILQIFTTERVLCVSTKYFTRFFWKSGIETGYTESKYASWIRINTK